MVRLLGGNALLGMLLGSAMVALGLTQHLPLFGVFGGYVGLVSLWRLVDDAHDRDRSDGP
jgi:hypothetical protein